jgi:hypothetical protein
MENLGQPSLRTQVTLVDRPVGVSSVRIATEVDDNGGSYFTVSRMFLRPF